MRELRRDALDLEPVWIDFRAEWYDWEFPQPATWDEEEEDPLVPYMMHVWPLPGFDHDGVDFNTLLTDEQAAVMVAKREEEEDWYLCMTAGGCDLSWDLAFGYMAAGLLPPTVILPKPFCDTRPTQMNQWILQGVTASQRIIGVHQGTVTKLRRLREELKRTSPPPRRWRARPGG